MKWMEMIRLRSSDTGRRGCLPSLREQVAQAGGTPGLIAAGVLRHAHYDGDAAALLAWDNDRAPVPTREGMALADMMRRYGSVEHAVWAVDVLHLFDGNRTYPKRASSGRSQS